MLLRLALLRLLLVAPAPAATATSTDTTAAGRDRPSLSSLQVCFMSTHSRRVRPGAQVVRYLVAPDQVREGAKGCRAGGDPPGIPERAVGGMNSTAKKQWSL